MFEKLKLKKELKKYLNEYFYILPDGLYLKNNKKIEYSELIIKTILKNYDIGSLIKFKAQDLKYIPNIITEVKLYNSTKTFESVDIYELTIEYILTEIEQYKYSIKKNPYENFLEVVVLSTMIESLNNSKCLIGGMWSTGSLLTKPKKGKNSFEFFAKNVSEKNSYIQILRKKMGEYPKNFPLNAYIIKHPKFNNNKSDYSVFLEYRILQIKYKIVLQKICMHSAYMSEQQKKKFDAEIKLLRRYLSEYPVKIIKQ